MIVKQHISQSGDLILAICDDDLLGRKFEEGEKQLDLTSTFYNGKPMTEEQILKLLPKTHSLNIVGPTSIKFALKHKLIIEEKILYVQDVPFAMCIFESKN